MKPDSVQDKAQYRLKVYLHCSREEEAKEKSFVYLHKMWLTPAKRCSIPTVFNLPFFPKILHLKAFTQANLTNQIFFSELYLCYMEH